MYYIYIMNYYDILCSPIDHTTTSNILMQACKTIALLLRKVNELLALALTEQSWKFSSKFPAEDARLLGGS